MELEYYAILTEIGTAAIANATVLGQKIALTQFAVGDGGGSYYRPTKEMTALKGEKWRGEINSYEVDSSNPDLINVKAVIPALVGGFTIREMGLFDKDDRLIAISNIPDSVKITTDSGAVKEMEMVMELLVSNANIVSIQVNPTVSIATKEDIQKHNQSLNAHKEQFNEKVNTNLNNVSRETLLQKMGNVTENLENIVGTTENTGGTASAGTVMAKLNKLLTDWTSAKAVKIDTINNAIGTTANTGGTTSAGTVMAKLNKLLTDWTSARAAKLDTIGETADANGSATTGTIMAKLNKLLTDWTNSRATKIDTINTNVSNLNTRLTSTRASRLDNIGATSDTGGTATAGTIMAKLNKLIADGANSSSGDIGTVNDNIGKTTDTGGTSTAGTVMAKLNKLLTDWTTTRAGYITNLNSRLTSTRAGYLDKLANFGATTDTGGTATAGTAMAKLNKLLTDWTTARAGKIDTINTNTSNLNTRLTSTRAGYLDLLNRGVSIKNIQRGFFFVNIKNGVPVEDEYRITLSTIVPSKTFILASGKMFSASGTISEDRIDTIGTTYFIYLPGLAGTASGSYGVRWQAIEFY